MRYSAMFLCAALLLTGCGVSASPDEAQSPQTYTVACVGDSLTYGYGASDPDAESYPAALSGLTGNVCFQAVNYGFCGATAIRSVPQTYIRTKAYEDSLAYKADIYLCMLGSNDISLSDWQEEFSRDYEALLRAYQTLENQPLVVVLLPPHIYLGGSYDSRMPALNEALRQLAAELSLPVIDLFETSEDMEDCSIDGLHFNARGYARFAQEIRDRLCELLEEDP